MSCSLSLMSKELRFITKNEYKVREFQCLFENTQYRIIPAAVAIEEIQTEDMEALVSDKAIKARLGLPSPR